MTTTLDHARAMVTHDDGAGGRAILPLSPRVAMDKDHYLPVGAFGIWSFTDFADPRWVLGTTYIQLRQLANPKADSKSRWGAFTTRPVGELISGRASVREACGGNQGAKYPDFGCNFEVFANPDFLELETLGPMVELQREKWWNMLSTGGFSPTCPAERTMPGLMRR